MPARSPAHRHTRSRVVTAAVDDLQFLHPIKVGDLIILKSRVTCTFTTSLEVQVDVYSEEALTGDAAADEPRIPDLRRGVGGLASASWCRRSSSTRTEPRQVCEEAHARREQRLRKKDEALRLKP